LPEIQIHVLKKFERLYAWLEVVSSMIHAWMMQGDDLTFRCACP